MFNFYETILNTPDYYKQLSVGESLITIYNCPLENRFADIWANLHYILYVTEGKKVWHTSHGSYELNKGDCVFVRKGGCIVEQFFDTPFCLFVFFISDDFICETLQSKSIPIAKVIDHHFDPLFPIHTNEPLEAFFHSMSSYFSMNKNPDSSLLELKFRELILTIADDTNNKTILSYFCSLLHQPQSVTLQQIMEDNFCYNLSLEAFAKLCNRSLSAFKRDFQKTFDTSPGKWLLERRLQHAHHLLNHLNKTVSEAAFESGFENTSHFSRAFKLRYGKSPLSVKQILLS